MKNISHKNNDEHFLKDENPIVDEQNPFVYSSKDDSDSQAGKKQAKKRRKLRKKKILFLLLSILLVVPFAVILIISAVMYESNFNTYYRTVSWKKFSLDDYKGLQMERSDFKSKDVTLAGYKYSKPNQAVKGVVVISHGLGCGGHNMFMPFIDYFTTNGYYVFTYDARGNDNSEGDSIKGLPEGIVDLDNAINHLSNVEEYRQLPVMLFGHSWGGYSVGNVLNIHPEVKSAAIIAGFNESSDMIEHRLRETMEEKSSFMSPFISFYEQLKFGRKYTGISAISGMEKTSAGILIAHGKSDTVVPPEYGYEKFYDKFGADERFNFVFYENKGHNYILYSEDAWDYQKKLTADYRNYLKQNGKTDNPKVKAEYMTKHYDKKKSCEPNPELMSQIIEMYDNYKDK